MDQPKTPPEPTIEDVSARFAGLKPSDRVFRSASGYLVKVRTLRGAGEDATALHFRLTGALCGDDGKALPHGDGYFIGAPHALTIHAESTVDLAAEILAARELIVRRMETAALHHAAAQALEGVG